ncbi:MAG: tRNA 4-thiouridine(8) synthase ThiI [Actinobacteria bacterium]|nr:tRNA 4-thiouridine(8) synthase ThiI [Actinomycetota bacterium]
MTPADGGAGGMGRRALVLFSGGLDSMLAAELLRRCGVEVTALTFVTPFFGSSNAERAAGALGLELVVADITERHLEVLKNPRYGYGKNMNPCIDCHALMARVALERLGELRADFIATGEVLGERPKSQNRQALELVARHSGAGDLLLRPLSARLLPETRPEREGWVRRDKLLDLSGRSRRRQMELAEEWGIGEYESPAGGCLLTDAGFSARLRELMLRVPGFDGADAELLKVGRHAWTGSTLIVLGRRHAENQHLVELALPGDMLLKERDNPGPTALLRAFPRGASPNRREIGEAARLLGIYGKQKKPLKPQDLVEVPRGDWPHCTT